MTQTAKPEPHNPTNAAFDHLRDAEAPLTAEQEAAAVLDGTKARRERARQDANDAAKELVAVAADVRGVTAALDCITQGDIGSCGQAVIQIAIDFVAGAAFKLIKKYGLPWNMHKGIAAGKKLWKLADRLIDRVRGFFRASDDVAAAGDDALAAARAARDTKAAELVAARRPSPEDTAETVVRSRAAAATQLVVLRTTWLERLVGTPGTSPSPRQSVREPVNRFPSVRGAKTSTPSRSSRRAPRMIRAVAGGADEFVV